MTEELLDYFTIHAAQTQADVDRIQHLRWAVYCRDFHYEREEDCYGERERDAFDDRAIHAYALHQPSGVIAGCVRIICASSLAPGELLPFHQAYVDRAKPAEIGWLLDSMPRASLFEVSRLAVASQFRRRKGEQSSPQGVVEVGDLPDGAIEARSLPMLSLTLILAATALGELHGLHDACAMMQPRLARLLARFGFEFRQIAPLIDYHGERAAFHLTVESALRGIRGESRELYEFIRSTLNAEMKHGELFRHGGRCS